MEKGVFIYYDTLVTRRELDLSGLDKFFAEKIHLYRRKIWAGHWNMLKAAQTQPAGTSAS
jgi:hypothetical protein